MQRLQKFFCLVFVGAALMFSAQGGLAAQGFGFGDEGLDAGTAGTSGSSASPALFIGGEVSASLLGYVDDFSHGAGSVWLGDVFSGKLNFKAGISFADAVINLKFTPTTSPIALDEAYLRLYLGPFDIEAGLRKLTWGKADSSGPLDVVNPLDYADLSLLVDSSSDAMAMKIARPLVHVTWNASSFSKLEGVFVPGFEPLRFAETGRWAPRQMAVLSQFPPVNIIRPDTHTLDYAQAGIRFTTTIGSSDIGAQYYYGLMTLPAFSLSFTGPFPTGVKIDYNRYHQFGLDFARVFAGFNVRAELAANTTGDTLGENGAVYNPRLAWSLGFDRDVIWGVNLNLQAAETVILLHDKIGPLPDIEAGSRVTSTRITAKLAKTFLRDELEIAASAIWGIEDGDCLVMPAVTWTKGDVAVELASGIFAGDEDGQFGQYRNNSFVRVRVKYIF
jgi:hypothetical protein